MSSIKKIYNGILSSLTPALVTDSLENRPAILPLTNTVRYKPHTSMKVQ
jgi:hypothetical protein